jgi:dTDP-4-amino-4,6-dideoxygalactose transaminase
VFVDCDDTLTLSPDRVRAALTPATRAVVFVSFFGNPGNIRELAELCAELGLPMVHDCAQGAASTLDGRWIAGYGDLTVLSLYETKHIAAGEGGALLTDSAEWFLRAKGFANLHETLPSGVPTAVHADFGQLPRYAETGVNGRLPVLTAVLAGHALGRLDRTREHCAAIGDDYRAALAEHLVFPRVPAGARVGWYGLPGRMRVPGLRDGLWRAVLAEGVGIARYYYTVLPDNAAFRTARCGRPGVPVTRELDRETVILPTHWRIGEREQADVVRALRKVCSVLRSAMDTTRRTVPELAGTVREQR